MSIATLTNLTVRYGRRVAVADLSVAIPEGCTGLLGPNGAGKTTLLKTLMGFIKPARGGGEALGWNIARDGLHIRRRVGLMPEVDCHIPGMSAVAFVAYAGELCGMPAAAALRRAHETLDYVGLGEARYRAVDTFSTGMRQRAKLAQALVHGPDLLLLDEPTNGLDPAGREEMLGLIRDVSHARGVHTVVSSHLLRDVEQVCDSVVVMRGGAVVEQGSVQDLRARLDRQVVVTLREPSDAFAAAMLRRGAEGRGREGARYRFMPPDGADDVAALLFEAAREAGAQVRAFQPARRSLEEVFMEAVG